ncbi:MAG: CoA transferase subunit A [Myxococcales bacterium]|nr:CoA transferase subunit A [Myxococcales bacterium]USN50424.1 MAG: CoA transferase subunit A [Myxococcales bacterium]
MNKIIDDLIPVIGRISNGATIMVGGFGLCGIPEHLIYALFESGVKDLTIISNNCGTTDLGLGILLAQRRIKKMISSYVGENKIFEQQFLSGELEVELVPQGTLAEKIRAGGAGIPAFYTPTGVHTMVSDGGLPMLYDSQNNVLKSSQAKEIRRFNDRDYVLEESLRADFALIKAHEADTFGNLRFNKTARNFNPIMAQAAAVSIVEVENIVPLGSLDPDQIHLSGAYIQCVYKGQNYKKWIEQRTVRPRPQGE